MDQFQKNIVSPALKLFGIDPDRIIFIQLYKEKELLWAMEEALKCNEMTMHDAKTDTPRFPFPFRTIGEKSN